MHKLIIGFLSKKSESTKALTPGVGDLDKLINLLNVASLGMGNEGQLHLRPDSVGHTAEWSWL